jgi:hypothetical protein
MLQQVFEFTHKESDNPDIRERGYYYFRLLAIDPNIAAQIVLTEKPRISEDSSTIESSLLDKLVDNLGSLASIYVKPPELFVKKTKIVNLGEEEETEYEDNTFNLEDNESQINKTIQDTSKVTEETVQSEEEYKGNQEQKKEVNLIDFNDIIGGSTSKPSQSSNIIDLFSSNLMDNFSSMSVKSRYSIIPKQCVIQENTQGHNFKTMGFAIDASLQREDSGLFIYLTFSNKTNNIIQDFELGLDKNYFGLVANGSTLKGLMLRPMSSEDRKVEIMSNISPDVLKIPNYDPPLLLQAAIRTNLDEYYFKIPILFFVLFEPQREKISLEEYTRIWKNIQTTSDMCSAMNLNPKYQNLDAVSLALYRSSNVLRLITFM